MEFNSAFWLQMGIYALTIAMVYGRQTANMEAFKEQIKRLELKMDKYNNLQERTAIMERDCAAFHSRLDRKGDEISRLRDELHEHCLEERKGNSNAK